MGIAERKTREKEERRKLILEVAKRLILDRGVIAVSMQDIADAAELSKATLYLYFPSKEDILSEILEGSADAFVAYVEERLDPAAGGLSAIRTLWESYLGFYAESPDIFVCIGIKNYLDPYMPVDIAEGAEEPLRPERKIRRLIAKVLKRGVGDGTLEPSLDPDKIARITMMITAAIISNVASLPREARDAALIREDMRSTFELFLRGLAAPNAERSLLSLSPP